MHADKWVNGTVLKYAFFESKEPFTRWAGTDALRSQARKAFQRYTDLGIGVRFEAVTERAGAQVRIGFEQGDGHWSYIGRQVLKQGADDRTMNLDPTDGIASGNYGIDVATHEIGHTLGFPHEHQNPNAGIVWDEEAVYKALGGPPNNWPRQTTFHNIIEKIQPDQIQGSSWDPDSIMHYPFEPGLILKPEQYRQGLQPAGGLSARDREWVHAFYPPSTAADDEALPLLESKRLQINPGEQRSFVLKPTVDRYYEIRTFGASDTVIVLYERAAGGRETYVTGDDDSGEERNAYIRRRLHGGRTYVLRVRLYYAADSGDTGVMWW
ncbi:MAG TPA: M12 family metallopeptidase [Methylomirabilota bacterium]